jgi:hypothetical protein
MATAEVAADNRECCDFAVVLNVLSTLVCSRTIAVADDLTASSACTSGGRDTHTTPAASNR